MNSNSVLMYRCYFITSSSTITLILATQTLQNQLRKKKPFTKRCRRMSCRLFKFGLLTLLSFLLRLPVAVVLSRLFSRCLRRYWWISVSDSCNSCCMTDPQIIACSPMFENSAAGNWARVFRVTGGNTNHYTTTDLGKWLNQVCLRSIHWEPQHNKCVALSVSPMSGDLCFFIDHCRCLLFELPTLAGIVLFRAEGEIRAATVRARFAPLPLAGCLLPSSRW